MILQYIQNVFFSRPVVYLCMCLSKMAHVAFFNSTKHLVVLLDMGIGNETTFKMYCVLVVGDVEAACYMFAEIPSLSATFQSVMISGYAKVGDVDLAKFFFDEAPEKDKERVMGCHDFWLCTK